MQPKENRKTNTIDNITQVMVGKQWVKSWGMYRCAGETSIQVGIVLLPFSAILTNFILFEQCCFAPLFSYVVFISPAIFWRQQIGWSYCAGSRFGLVAWRNTKIKVTLSRKRSPARCVTVSCCDCYANGFRFGSRLADYLFFSLLFYRLCLHVMFKGWCC